MTMRLPRFRLRTLMIAVAVVGIVLIVERLRRLRGTYRERAELARQTEDLDRLCLEFAKSSLRPVSPGGKDMARVTEANRRLLEEAARERGEFERLLRYHSELRRKYERAARYPWLPRPARPAIAGVTRR